jgi:hypothetical protein
VCVCVCVPGWDGRCALGQYNPLKVHFIKEKVPDGTSSTVYRCGPLIDLCLGPHVASTARVKAFQVYKVRAALNTDDSRRGKRECDAPMCGLIKSCASFFLSVCACVCLGGGQHSMTYWLGKAENEQLLRVYGISFPEAKLLKEWLQWREEAARRDHRLIGRVRTHAHTHMPIHIHAHASTWRCWVSLQWRSNVAIRTDLHRPNSGRVGAAYRTKSCSSLAI